MASGSDSQLCLATFESSPNSPVPCPKHPNLEEAQDGPCEGTSGVLTAGRLELARVPRGPQMSY